MTLAGRNISFTYRLTWVVSVVLMTAGIPFLVDFILHPLQAEPVYGSALIRIVEIIICLITITIGLLCVRNVPGNVIGPLLIIFGASQILGTVRNTASLALIVFSSELSPIVFWVTYGLLLACFPTGNFHYRRLGKWANTILVVFWILLSFSYVFGIGSFSYFLPDSPAKTQITNPFFRSQGGIILNILTLVFVVIVSTYIGFAFISQVMRYRAAGWEVRQQMKWFLFGFMVWFAPQIVTGLFPNVPEWVSSANSVYYYAGTILFPPIAIGIAILRYRLYDIDIIIRRTLVYSVLTAILALIYFGGVVLAQAALRPLIGENSDAGIVISTLLIAALFSPLRRRVQNIIDRRFYRRKYDAERTLAAFNATMRHEVDLDKLQGALVNVVQETMQPKVVSLWIRSSSAQTKS